MGSVTQYGWAACIPGSRQGKVRVGMTSSMGQSRIGWLTSHDHEVMFSHISQLITIISHLLYSV